jgi:hypothetical protein
MTVNFPAISPTACSFTPPEWPITESRSQSGVRSYRIWANKPSDALLDLGFENISERDGFRIVRAHSSAKGPIDDVTLPSAIFSGIEDENLLDFISQNSSGLSWHFINGEPPVLERVPGRRYSTRVRLRAELRFSDDDS